MCKLHLDALLRWNYGASRRAVKVAETSQFKNISNLTKVTRRTRFTFIIYFICDSERF